MLGIQVPPTDNQLAITKVIRTRNAAPRLDEFRIRDLQEERTTIAAELRFSYLRVMSGATRIRQSPD